MTSLSGVVPVPPGARTISLSPPAASEHTSRSVNGSALVSEPARQPSLDEAIVQARLKWLRNDREAKRRLEAEATPPLVLPPLMTLKDRLALPVSETRWRIEGWLPVDARVMLSAQYKAGKTTLVTNLIRSLVDGDDW